MEELKTIITEFRGKRGWEKYDTLERFSKSIGSLSNSVDLEN